MGGSSSGPVLGNGVQRSPPANDRATGFPFRRGPQRRAPEQRACASALPRPPARTGWSRRPWMPSPLVAACRLQAGVSAAVGVCTVTPFSLQSLEAGERRKEAPGWTGFRGRPAGVCWLLKGSFYVTRFTEKTHKSTGQGVPWGTRVPDSVELSRTNYSHACRLPSGAPKMPNGPPWPTPGASCDSWTG